MLDSLLSTLYLWLIAPFDYAFMSRALLASLALSLAAPPLGVFLMLRGMSLIGDAMSHAILPGVALGFLLNALPVPMLATGFFLGGFGAQDAAKMPQDGAKTRQDAL